MRTGGDPPPSSTVLKKSILPRVLQRFIPSHRDLLYKCSLDGKGLYKCTSPLTTEDHVSSTESWFVKMTWQMSCDFLYLVIYYIWIPESRLIMGFENTSAFCSHLRKTCTSLRSSN